MKIVMTYSFEKKRYAIFPLITILFLLSLKVTAQNDTIFFDKNWKTSSKEMAIYYRIKPSKIKTKDAIGYEIKNIDSLFVIKDYYLSSNKIQFKGYSKDYNGDFLIGKAEWHNAIDGKMYTREYNYKTNNNNSKFKTPDWPILYINYSIADKSLFTGGLEFCLDCEEYKNKLFLGLGYGITNSYNDKYYGLPDIHLSYNTEYLLFIKAGSSNKSAYVLGGLTLLNLIDLGLGYSFPYNKESIPAYEGFTASLTFRITKSQKVYTKLFIP
ncbi:hypothetical protein AAYQ05_15575 [Flavobacterium sp. B11]|uniref:hypothetical protein n=1 Tax=Flavobacterium movens TaxID=214860 RepID=UPI0031DF8F2C